MTTAAPGWLHPSHPGRPLPGSRPLAPARRWSTRVSTVAVGACCTASWVVGFVDPAAVTWVWVVALLGLLLGIPHGAVDHLQAGRLLRDAVRSRTGSPVPVLVAQACAGGAYAALAAGSYLLFLAAPGPALLVFLVLSVLHFGTGEVELRPAGPLAHARRRWVTAAVLGSLVLLVPLARAPGLTAAVVDHVAAGMVLPRGWSTVVLAVALPAAALLLVGHLVHRRRVEAAQLALLALLACTTPPLVALAVYFGGWHAVRHTAQLLVDDPDLRRARQRRGLPGAVGSLALRAALPTAVVLVGLGLLLSAADSPTAAVAASLPVLAAVTVPHTVVVTAQAVARRRDPLRTVPATAR